MNKSELTEAVQKALGKDTSKRAAGDAVEAVLTSIAKGIKKDKAVQLIGFGTFKDGADGQVLNQPTGFCKCFDHLSLLFNLSGIGIIG